MKVSQRLHESAKQIWEKSYHHPFVQGIGDGSLPRETFQFYMKQDYVFLIEYSRLFAVGAMKADHLEIMGKFAEMLHRTLHGEMDLHRSYAERLGISREELEQTQATPANLAYTRYMLQAAQTGTLADMLASMLPCAWGYREIGTMLAKQYPDAIHHPFYGDWVRMYASKEYGEVAQWKIDLLDELAEGKPERELAVLEEHFIQASRFEYMFWDMAYHGHDWPV